MNSADSLEEFGAALHGYQDSFSHYQKLGQPGTLGEIWEAHKQNQLDTGFGFFFAKTIDNYDPSVPYSTDWNMVQGTMVYVDQFLEEYLGEAPSPSEEAQ